MRRQKKRKHWIANYSLPSFSLPCVLAMGSLTSTASSWLIYKLQPGPWFIIRSVQHPTVKNFKLSLSVSSFIGTEPVSTCFRQRSIKIWQSQHSTYLFKAWFISYFVHRKGSFRCTCTHEAIQSQVHLLSFYSMAGSRSQSINETAVTLSTALISTCRTPSETRYC